MGTFTFRWPHAAEEVYVTGTFDGWSKSEQLDKVGDHFEKTVTLPDFTEKVYYKFVVDGRWTTDHTAPQEKDHEGNENNVLLPENLIRTTDPSTQEPEQQAMSNENRKVEGSSNTGEPSFAETIMSALNTVTPDSTAQSVSNPLENKKNHGPPGGWVETPAADGDKTFSVSPLPATDGALNPIDLKPGEKIPDSFSAQNVNTHVTLDKESYEKSDRIPGVDFSTSPVAAPTVTTDAETEFKVNPLPATEGALNPFKLAPGEKIPDDVRAADINTNVTLDKESYENSPDRIPGLDAALPPISKNMIPESSLPITSNNDVFINTVTPISTTAALAAQVPFDEPAVPEAVRESQEKAHVEPGASGMAEEVKVKAAVEDELLHKVSEVPSTSEGTAGYGTEKAETDLSLADAVAFAGNAAAAAVVGAATVAADKLPGVLESTANAAVNVGSKIPGAVNATANAAVDVGSKIGQTASEALGTTANAATNAAYAAKDTTSDVLGSAANVAASAGTQVQETAANTASTVQQTTADATSTVASSLPSVPDVTGHLPQAVQNILPTSFQPAFQNGQALPTSAEVERSLAAEKASRVEGISAAVPIEVKDSIEKAGESPEATTNAAAVLEKQAVEAELLREVKPTQAEPPAVAASVPSEVRDSLQQADESPEAAAYPAAVEDKKAVENELLKTVKPTESVPLALASAVPGTVKDSITEAGKAPEAAANADVVAEKTAVEAQLLQEVKPVEVVADKKAVEAELLHEVKRTEPTGESSTKATTNGTATNGSAANGSPANGAAANGSTAAASKPVETPVTPTTPTATEGFHAANGNGKATEQPTVTTGPETTTTTTASASTTPERKKKNRVSGFFSKLKHKFA